jgi:disulfide bond formation protein DsbB
MLVFHERSERMMNDYLAIARKNPPLAAAAIVAVLGALAIGGFFFFEYGLGYPPCPLCLEQRIPYYICVPLAVLLWLGAGFGASRKVMILGFLAIAAAMLWDSGLAAYHAGVEWRFWPGPTDCSGPISKFGAARSLIKQLQHVTVVRCDEAAWRFLGLSLAGWNVPLSLGLAAVAAWGAKTLLARRESSG